MIEPVNKGIVAVIFDFDKTLSQEYMQAPLFKYYKINEEEFWGRSSSISRKIPKKRQTHGHNIVLP